MAKTKSKEKITDVYGGDLLPDKLKREHIIAKIDDTEVQYAKVLKRMRLLDGAVKNQLWNTIASRFPTYQMTPESNWIKYIKDNIVASVYTTGRYADLFPRSADDIQYCNEFNKALQNIWEDTKAAEYQFQAGENAALFNIGVTQVGWKKDLLGGTVNHWNQGDVVMKNINPMYFRRDPYADNFDNAEFCYYFDEFSETYLKTVEDYGDRLRDCLKHTEMSETLLQKFDVSTDKRNTNSGKNKYHRLTYFYIMYSDLELDDEGKKKNKHGFKIAEIHLLDDKYVLLCKEDLKPRMFPFAVLHASHPGNELVGLSDCASAFANYLTYNLISSFAATTTYKAQRPSKYVSVESGINLRQYTKYGNDADKTFVVRGDASKAVHEQSIAPIDPMAFQLQAQLARDIKDITGIDEMYAGKNTGSIQTTGGMEQLTANTTQRDNQRILLYESYSTRLTELVVNNLVEFGDKRTYTVNDPITGNVDTVEMDFPTVDKDIRSRYSLDMQVYLPRSKARMAAVANMLLEKQAQYGMDPEIITVEEWLLCQDIPFKDLIFTRMGIQRNTRVSEQVAQTLTMYSDLVEGGVDPMEAMDEVALQLQAEQTPTTLGNTASPESIQQMVQGGSPQVAQMGPQSNSFVEEPMI